MIRENLEEVEENIRKACERAGRDPKEVTLIAVSKTKPVSDVQEAYDCGIRDFGENWVQELTEKIPVLPDDIRWHMIGHLQRNKVKYIIDKAAMIHSVDSVRLAEEIQKQAEKKDVEMDILLEVNIAQEESKFGFKADEVEEAVKEISGLNRVHIKGLMTSAPFVENGEENRRYFRAMKELSVDLMKKNIDNVDMNVLSMGMTADYITAVEEGATMVRVGTAIFGQRNYNK